MPKLTGGMRDYVEASYRLTQLNKPDYFMVLEKHNKILCKAFDYVGLDYKKYIFIDKSLIRKNKNKTLVADTQKGKKLFNFKIKTNIDNLIKIMMENDLAKEKNDK